MGIVSGVVVYIVLWWITLYAVLPWGIQKEAVVEKGNEPGAPRNPRVKLKLWITSGIALLAWVVVYSIIRADIPWLNDLFMNTGY